MWAVSFLLWLHNCHRKYPQYPLKRRLGGPQGRSGHFGEGINPLLCPECSNSSLDIQPIAYWLHQLSHHSFWEPDQTIFKILCDNMEAVLKCSVTCVPLSHTECWFSSVILQLSSLTPQKNTWTHNTPMMGGTMGKCIYKRIDLSYCIRLCNSLNYVSIMYFYILYSVRVCVLTSVCLIVFVKLWGHVSYLKPNGLLGLKKWNGMYVCMYVCSSYIHHSLCSTGL
jgi:hypothetical protein